MKTLLISKNHWKFALMFLLNHYTSLFTFYALMHLPTCYPLSTRPRPFSSLETSIGLHTLSRPSTHPISLVLTTPLGSTSSALSPSPVPMLVLQVLNFAFSVLFRSSLSSTPHFSWSSLNQLCLSSALYILIV